MRLPPMEGYCDLEKYTPHKEVGNLFRFLCDSARDLFGGNGCNEYATVKTLVLAPYESRPPQSSVG